MRSLMDKEYDIVFILQDLGVIVPTIKLLKDIQRKSSSREKAIQINILFPRRLCFNAKLDRRLGALDYLATFTNFGKAQVLRRNNKIQKKLHVVPHGTDSTRLLPITRR